MPEEVATSAVSCAVTWYVIRCFAGRFFKAFRQLSRSIFAQTVPDIGWRTRFFIWSRKPPRDRRVTKDKLAKLSEALFVDTLRRYVAGLPEQEVGWLAAARDPVVGKSLSLLHAKAQHPWTIAELAKEVGLSRSTLVERFTRYLEEPPIAYL